VLYGKEALASFRDVVGVGNVNQSGEVPVITKLAAIEQLSPNVGCKISAAPISEGIEIIKGSRSGVLRTEGARWSERRLNRAS
jgi:hypothetical protein